jgi:hypothetical protein
MRAKEKTKLRVQIATKATIASLRAFEEKNPGKCIVKREILPHIARRAGWIMEDDYDPVYDTAAIPPPDVRFIENRWSEICLHAAEAHKRYIVWEPHHGIRLGTFEEYESTQRTLADIAQGLVDNVEDRAKIIKNQGGRAYAISIKIKQLPSKTSAVPVLE